MNRQREFSHPEKNRHTFGTVSARTRMDADNLADYESEGRAFESLRDHQESPLDSGGFVVFGPAFCPVSFSVVLRKC